MLFSKFSFLFLVLMVSTSAEALTRFLPKSCLDANYKTKIAHRGPLFGLLPHELTVEKKGCLINIQYRRYLPKEWTIDVCREPVHIKVASATGTDVAKKTDECVKPDKSKNTSNFCGQYFDLIDVLQDDGLIFAEGDRDSLGTPHGRIYCAYLLLERYLTDEIMFSRYTQVANIFDKGGKEAVVEVEKAAPVAPVAPVTPGTTVETKAP